MVERALTLHDTHVKDDNRFYFTHSKSPTCIEQHVK